MSIMTTAVNAIGENKNNAGISAGWASVINQAIQKAPEVIASVKGNQYQPPVQSLPVYTANNQNPSGSSVGGGGWIVIVVGALLAWKLLS